MVMFLTNDLPSIDDADDDLCYRTDYGSFPCYLPTAKSVQTLSTIGELDRTERWLV